MARVPRFKQRTVLALLAGLAALAPGTPAFADTTNPAMPVGFVDAETVAAGLVVDMRYYGAANFVGRPIAGYDEPVCLLTSDAATALARAQKHLQPLGLGLKAFDCYRPARAVNDFVRWAKDLDDQIRKPLHYPDVPKSELFQRGYIATRSGHSRGSTVDVTIVDLVTGQELDMGTVYDWFGPKASPTAHIVSRSARAHRLLLRLVMRDAGFQPYEQEWWHFTLNSEPYPDFYFDFPLRRSVTEEKDR